MFEDQNGAFSGVDEAFGKLHGLGVPERKTEEDKVPAEEIAEGVAAVAVGSATAEEPPTA